MRRIARPAIIVIAGALITFCMLAAIATYQGMSAIDDPDYAFSWTDARNWFLSEFASLWLGVELWFWYDVLQPIWHIVVPLLWAALIAAIAYCFYWLATAQKRADQKKDAKCKASDQRELERLGSTVDARAEKIDEIFDDRITSIQVDVDVPEVRCVVSRELSAMSPREREALRTAYHLQNLGMLPSINFYAIRLSLVYAQGKGTVFTDNDSRYSKGTYGSINEAVEKRSGALAVEPAVDSALRDLTANLKHQPDHPVLKRLSSRLFGDGGDMLPGPPLKSAPKDAPVDGTLLLGLDPNNSDNCWYYDGEGSLITIAPPGAGKTQSQVFPNLLTWKGPAVVLDVKGEIYAQTSGWRRENVGPIYKFSPLDPVTNHCFNPLATVRSDHDYVWEDSRFLADMMIVPSKAPDPFWERSARDVLTAAIAIVCISEGETQRSIPAVLDILHGVGWKDFVDSLKAYVKIGTMARVGHSLAQMDAKLRDSVLKSAQASMSAWEGERIARATRKSDWHPLDLRSGLNPTVYICLAPNEIDSYASILRVLIAQHIRTLTSTLPERGTPSILFVLDELPRMKHMPPVEDALEIGRQYGLRLWMFIQSLGQLKKDYPNAEGMIGSCAIRMFMNPSLHDGTAKKLSEDIGYRESIVDGSRVKVVEPNVLAGPDFKDSVIVMAASAKPAKLKKYFAYDDPALTARMGSY